MQLTEQLATARVLVVGDVMLDRYWWGSVTRISPEAPVPVVRLQRSSLAAGGAANVAANIVGLGAKPILIGIVGNDPEAQLLRGVLSDCGVAPDDLIETANRPTTAKTRVVAHGQQVVRVDRETEGSLTAEDAEKVVKKVSDTLELVDAIVVSDYAKGMLTNAVLSEILDSARVKGISVLVDPKGKDYSKYRGSTLLTPNRREAAEACKLEDCGSSVVEIAGTRLLTEIGGSVLITQGDEGMTLFQADREPLHYLAMAREVYDVTGAGDTVIATVATALATGATLARAAQMANTAAGIVVEQVGTTTISASELHLALNGQ